MQRVPALQDPSAAQRQPQAEGLDTYEANRALGFADDARDFRDAAAVLQHPLGGQSFRLLTSNPDKTRQLRALGLRHVVQESHVAGAGPRNRRYLGAKRDRGHWIPAPATGSD